MKDDQVKQILDAVNAQAEVTNTRFESLSGEIRAQSNVLNRRIDKLERHITDQFAIFYRHFELRFDELQESKADRSQVADIFALLDKESKELETDRQERIALGSQVDRLERRMTKFEQSVA